MKTTLIAVAAFVAVTYAADAYLFRGKYYGAATGIVSNMGRTFR